MRIEFSLKWAFVAALAVGLLIWALSPHSKWFYWQVQPGQAGTTIYKSF